MTPEQLAMVAEALKQPMAYQRAAWQKVVDIGRNYAMAKAHGCYIENGRKIRPSGGDQQSMIQYFEQNLLRAVQDAFVEDALFGAAVAEQTHE